MSASRDESPLRTWIRDGNFRKAGEWLVREYGRDVYALCAAMLRDRSVAEDLTQETFSRAFRSLSAFRGEASLRTWLLSIARNQCIDHLRARKRDVVTEPDPLDDEAHADAAPLPADLLENHRSVEAALGTLPETERALVVLRFRQGLEYSELAQAFGLREGAVRMRLSRALSRMRAVLEAPADGAPAVAAPAATTRAHIVLGAARVAAMPPAAPMPPSAMPPAAPMPPSAMPPAASMPIEEGASLRAPGGSSGSGMPGAFSDVLRHVVSDASPSLGARLAALAGSL